MAAVVCHLFIFSLARCRDDRRWCRRPSQCDHWRWLSVVPVAVTVLSLHRQQHRSPWVHFFRLYPIFLPFQNSLDRNCIFFYSIFCCCFFLHSCKYPARSGSLRRLRPCITYVYCCSICDIMLLHSFHIVWSFMRCGKPLRALSQSNGLEKKYYSQTLPKSFSNVFSICAVFCFFFCNTLQP